jgi:uncharacterized protein YraI
MNALTSLRYRLGRREAAVGAMVAVAAAGVMASVAGAAAGAAAPAGRCTENLNVRSAPDPRAEIVAVCPAGTEVHVGEAHGGFVRLVDLGGWTVAQYVTVPAVAAALPVQRTPDQDVALTPPPTPETDFHG